MQKESVNPEHPFSKFSVGNEETLADRESGSTRDEIIQFHANHYSADLMSLVLVGPQDLDNQEQIARSLFSEIKNQGLKDKKVEIPLLTEKQQQLWIELEPEKEVRKLSLSFSFPNMQAHYQTKPLSYLAHLIGYGRTGQHYLVS